MEDRYCIDYEEGCRSKECPLTCDNCKGIKIVKPNKTDDTNTDK